MAKRTTDDDDDRDLENEEEGESRDEDDEEEEEQEPPKKAAAKPASKSASKEPPAKSKKDEESDEDEDEEEDEESDEDDSAEEEEEQASAEADDAEAKPEGEEDEELLPAQLGVQRYVYATVFGAILLGAYVLGRAIDGLWQYAASKDAVVLRAPWLATVSDDSKANYSLIIGGVLAALYGLYKYRKPSVRAWLDEVTTELVKVKWPSRKDVFNSTTVVLTTTAVAVVYLFLLDRFWGFVTNLIYGGGT